MARNFLDFPSAAYAGTLLSKAFSTTRGKGTMVTANVRWKDYPGAISAGNFSVAASLNISGAGVAPAGWFIQSCYVDNEGVDFPVYVQFPDTGFSVSCPANAAGWYSCFTLGRTALISAIGITQNALSVGQRTRVFFTDIVMVPFVDEEQQSALSLQIASPTLQVGSIFQAGYAPPALGDQTLVPIIGLSGVQPDSPIPMGPFPGEFIYLTQVQALATNMVANASGGTATVSLRNTVSGVAVAIPVSCRPSLSEPPIIVKDLRANLRFDANQSWMLRLENTSNMLGGTMNVTIVYTVNPK